MLWFISFWNRLPQKLWKADFNKNNLVSWFFTTFDVEYHNKKVYIFFDIFDTFFDFVLLQYASILSVHLIISILQILSIILNTFDAFECFLYFDTLEYTRYLNTITRGGIDTRSKLWVTIYVSPSPSLFRSHVARFFVWGCLRNELEFQIFATLKWTDKICQNRTEFLFK